MTKKIKRQFRHLAFGTAAFLKGKKNEKEIFYLCLLFDRIKALLKVSDNIINMLCTD